jgi:ferredoxin
MERKKVVIDATACIGCAACVGTYPDDFTLTDDGLAATVTGEADTESVDVCPTGAISVEE